MPPIKPATFFPLPDLTPIVLFTTTLSTKQTTTPTMVLPPIETTFPRTETTSPPPKPTTPLQKATSSMPTPTMPPPTQSAVVDVGCDDVVSIGVHNVEVTGNIIGGRVCGIIGGRVATVGICLCVVFGGVVVM
jgi:hypothetical protein